MKINKKNALTTYHEVFMKSFIKIIKKSKNI